MKIVVCGNFGAKNLGDEMILQGVLKMIEENFPGADVTVLSGDPKSTANTFHVNSVPKFPSGVRSFLLAPFGRSATRDAVKNCDYFLLGGGGLFGGPEFKGNFVWGVQAWAAYHYKKPVIIYGQSVGNVRNPLLKIFLKSIFQKAKFIGVRDYESKKLLNSWGITHEISVLPDMAFRRSRSDLSPSPSDLSPSPNSDEKTVIVALRKLRKINKKFRHEVAEFLNWLIKSHGYKVLFVDFQDGVHGDTHLHDEVISQILYPDKVQHLKWGSGVNELIEYFEKAEFVLGMRLHSIITAVKSSVPFISINYASKVRNFLNYCHLSDCGLEFDAINFENLKHKYLEVQKDKTKIIEKMKTFDTEAFKKHLETEKSLNRKIRKDFL